MRRKQRKRPQFYWQKGKDERISYQKEEKEEKHPATQLNTNLLNKFDKSQ